MLWSKCFWNHILNFEVIGNSVMSVSILSHNVPAWIITLSCMITAEASCSNVSQNSLVICSQSSSAKKCGLNWYSLLIRAEKHKMILRHSLSMLFWVVVSKWTIALLLVAASLWRGAKAASDSTSCASICL